MSVGLLGDVGETLDALSVEVCPCILDATAGFLARANRESLFGRVRTNFDGIDVNTAGNAWLEAVLVM